MAYAGSTARTNNASYALINRNRGPYAEGAFRYVYDGRYTKGERAGKRCVSKVFKTGAVFEEEFFETELEVVSKALHILSQWNGAGFIRQTVRLNKPEVYCRCGRSRQVGRRTWLNLTSRAS